MEAAPPLFVHDILFEYRQRARGRGVPLLLLRREEGGRASRKCVYLDTEITIPAVRAWMRQPPFSCENEGRRKEEGGGRNQRGALKHTAEIDHSKGGWLIEGMRGREAAQDRLLTPPHRRPDWPLPLGPTEESCATSPDDHLRARDNARTQCGLGARIRTSTCTWGEQ